jgi:hypothetical protein
MKITLSAFFLIIIIVLYLGINIAFISSAQAQVQEDKIIKGFEELKKGKEKMEGIFEKISKKAESILGKVFGLLKKSYNELRSIWEEKLYSKVKEKMKEGKILIKQEFEKEKKEMIQDLERIFLKIFQKKLEQI